MTPILLLLTVINFYTSAISGLSLKNDFLKVEPFGKMPLKILSQFQDYSLIVHFDALTGQELGVIFGNGITSGRPTYILNYEVSIKFDHPAGYKYINIVYLTDPFDYANYTSTDYIYGTEAKDIVLFVLKKFETFPRNTSNLFDPTEKIKRIWDMEGLDRAVSVMILDLATSRLFHCCFYCGNESAVLKQIAKGPRLPNLHHHVNTWSDFNGHVFRIAYADFPPFFWCRNVSNKCQPEGAESEVLKTISEKLNFKFTLVKYESELNPGGQWRALVEGAHFRRFDWAVGGISVSNERATSTDFTRYIKTQGFAFLYSTWEQPWLAVDNILLAFKFVVWVCISFSIVCIGLFSIAAIKVLNKPSTVYFFGYLKLATMPIVDQATTQMNPRAFVSTSIKSAFLIWWLMVLILTTMYKSQLASSLIKPNYNEPDNVESLVEAGFKYQANKEDWSVLRENLISSKDRIFSNVLNNINDDSDFCDSVYKTIGRRVAVIDEEVPIQYDVYKHCSGNLSKDDFSRLRLVTREIFSNTYHGWCMQMSTPFRLKFSRTIGRMDDNGLIQHWYSTIYSFKLPRSNTVLARDTVSLTVNQIFPALLVYAIGVTLSLVSFIYEFCFYSNCVRFIDQ